MFISDIGEVPIGFIIFQMGSVDLKLKLKFSQQALKARG
jgi:hypothetical protein